MLPCHGCYIYGTWTSKEVVGVTVIVWADGGRLEQRPESQRKRGNFYGGVDPSAILPELSTYFSLFWCEKREFYDMHYMTFLNRTS